MPEAPCAVHGISRDGYFISPGGNAFSPEENVNMRAGKKRAAQSQCCRPISAVI
jgi:hypothetical protein